MERDKGQGRPKGASEKEDRAPQKEQGGCRKESTANNPSGTLSSIRADQDVDTFIAGLRQNKEQLISLARKLRVRANDEATVEERGNNLALGVYLEVVLKEPYFSTSRPESIPPGDEKVGVWREGLDPFESTPNADAELQKWKEELAFWATERVASKWLVTNPNSEAAKEVRAWNIYGFPDQHHSFLKEMWPAILPQLSSQPEKKSSLMVTTHLAQ
jgi:hypothetical protein